MKKQIFDALDVLADEGAFCDKYGVENKGLLLYAAGDGNHSLATAKSCWEELKTKLARLDELNILLNMDKRENEIVGGEPDEGEVPNTRKEKTYER